MPNLRSAPHWRVSPGEPKSADYAGYDDGLSQKMSTITAPARPLPRWLILVGSIVITFHLFAVGIVVIAAQSGPWPLAMGSSTMEAPPFVWSLTYPGRALNDLALGYLRGLHLENNFHFSSNRSDFSTVRFEVRLKDKEGNVIQTLQFPEEGTNFWVRHRQSVVANALGLDEPAQTSRQNTLPEPGKEPDRIRFWDPVDPPRGRHLRLKSELVTKVSRDRPLMTPSVFSQLAANSYVRHLIRKYGAESGELTRLSRDSIRPEVLMTPQSQWQPDLFDELVADFTER
jgi:hypothetical protein